MKKRYSAAEEILSRRSSSCEDGRSFLIERGRANSISRIYMSNINRALKRWEEHVISHEKGNRIVQYRIVDNNMNSILAVVGSDRGQRHMTYTVMGDLFSVFGPVSKVPAGTKWTSRKTVVDFLSSLTSSSGPILATSSTQVLPEGSKKDVNVEVLCQDSGMRGCWFRCKILRSTQKNLKVQHCDVTEVDGPGKLEEWVVKSRVANPDKLGIRCEGRLTVRPWPQSDSSELKLGMGVAVDAWWSDGWWEGVITGYDMSSNDNLQVYSPGENKFLIVGKKDIRVSKDWVNDQWVDVKAKPDIFSFLNSYLNPLPKVKLPEINNGPPSVLGSGKVCDSTKVGGPGNEKMKLPGSSEAKKKSLEELQLEQLMKLKEKEDWTVRGSGNAAKKGKMVNLPARPTSRMP